jgi:hypothetical protein
MSGFQSGNARFGLVSSPLKAVTGKDAGGKRAEFSGSRR